MSTESMTTTGAAVPQAAADGVTNPKGIGLFRMVTTVITLIVGAGVFSLSGDAAAGGRERLGDTDRLGHFRHWRVLPRHDVLRAFPG